MHYNKGNPEKVTIDLLLVWSPEDGSHLLNPVIPLPSKNAIPNGNSWKDPLRYHHGTINVGIVDLSLGRLQPWKLTCKPQNHPIEREIVHVSNQTSIIFGVPAINFMTGSTNQTPLTRHDAHLAVKAPKAPATDDDMALG